MLIVLITVVVLALAAAVGFFQGAVRSLVSLLGALLGAALAIPLGAYLKPLVPKVGLENPIWAWVVPPVTVFILFLLVFTAIAFVAHRQVALYFKYKTDEYQLVSWERLNKRLGIGIGIVSGTIYAVLLSLSIYITGYLTVQVTAGETDHALLRFVSQARKDLQATGMDKLVARLDPMKEDYYLASDIVGLLHRNPLLEARLADYPFFLSLTERPELKDLGSDKEFQSLRERQPTLGDLINHPKVTAILANEDLMTTLRQADLKDLRDFLQTGKSAKYDDEKILGRWRMDPAPTVRALRKLSPEMTATQFSQAKKLVGLIAPLVRVTSSPDNKFTLEVNMAELSQQVLAMAATMNPQTAAPTLVAQPMIVQPPPQENQPDAQMRQRYGIRPGAPTPTPQAPIIATAPPAPRSGSASKLGGFPPIGAVAEQLKKLSEQQPTITAAGSWSRDGDTYTLKIQDPSGKEHEAAATADDERLQLKIPIFPPISLTLVFFRV